MRSARLLQHMTMNSSSTSLKLPSTEATRALLAAPKRTKGWRRTRVWLTGVLVVALAVAIYSGQSGASSKRAPKFVTETVVRGNLTLSIRANGVLRPNKPVSLGSELSGTVQRVLVDVNDPVKKGQVLVELDTTNLKTKVIGTRAALAAAHARVAQSEATVLETKTALSRLQELQRLSDGAVPAKSELSAAVAALARAQADEQTSHAGVAQAKASLDNDVTNVSKAWIRSPIDGIVLTRSVDPGNAVAASLQAVTLFTLAEDVTRLRLLVNVDEADVAAVKTGQSVQFSVSAFPLRSYPATVRRVAYAATVSEGVATYECLVDVSNLDGSLRPGMTAASTITATELKDVLMVPNPALRYSPESENTSDKPKASGGVMSAMMPRLPGGGARKVATENIAKQVWVLRGGVAVPIAVTTGISDGKYTEVSGGDLKAGMLVITDRLPVGTKQ